MNITVYRLVQECLTNVTKHAQATEVVIRISRDRPAHALHLDILDNGRGFDVAQPRNGLGLIGLRERVEALRGNFLLETGPGKGVRVRATIPLGDAK